MLVSQLQYIGPILIFFGIGLIFTEILVLNRKGFYSEDIDALLPSIKEVKIGKFLFLAGLAVTLVWLLLA
jgi:hypothetical protein